MSKDEPLMGPKIEEYGKVLSFSILVGFFVLCRYFASGINFVPVGLDLEDYLVFALSGFVFGIVYCIWLLLGTYVWLGLRYLAINPATSCSTWTVGILHTLGGVGMALFLTWLCYEAGDVFAAAFVIISGGIFGHYIEQWDRSNSSPGNVAPVTNNKVQKLMITIAIVIPAIFGLKVTDQFIESTIKDLGYSHQHVSLLLNDANLDRVRAYSRKHGLPIFGCSYESDLKNVVHNFDVKWHGKGDKSLVRALVPVSRNGKVWDSMPPLVLDYDGLDVLANSEFRHKGAEQLYSSCISVGSDSLFDANAWDLNPLGERKIEELMFYLNKYIHKGQLELKSLEIIGHADRRKVLKGSNLELSEKRATTVKDELISILKGLEEIPITVYGMGDLMPITDCSYEMKGRELDFCLSADRRVDIKFKFLH